MLFFAKVRFLQPEQLTSIMTNIVSTLRKVALFSRLVRRQSREGIMERNLKLVCDETESLKKFCGKFR